MKHVKCVLVHLGKRPLHCSAGCARYRERAREVHVAGARSPKPEKMGFQQTQKGKRVGITPPYLRHTGVSRDINALNTKSSASFNDVLFHPLAQRTSMATVKLNEPESTQLQNFMAIFFSPLVISLE